MSPVELRNYHLFRRLPLELQLLVWGSAAWNPEPRYHPLQSVHYRGGRFDYTKYVKQFTTQRPIPPLLHSCHDCREEAIKTYSIINEITEFVNNPRYWTSRFGNVDIRQLIGIFKEFERSKTRLRYVQLQVDSLVRFSLHAQREPSWSFARNREHEYNFSLPDIERFQNMTVLGSNDNTVGSLTSWNKGQFQNIRRLELLMLLDVGLTIWTDKTSAIWKFQRSVLANRFKWQVWKIKMPNAQITYFWRDVDGSTRSWLLPRWRAIYRRSKGDFLDVAWVFLATISDYGCEVGKFAHIWIRVPIKFDKLRGSMLL